MHFLSLAQCEQLLFSVATVTTASCLFAMALKRDFPSLIGSIGLASLATGVAVGVATTWGQTLIYTTSQYCPLGVFSLTFRLDDLNRLFAALFSIIAFAIAIFSPDYLRSNSNIHRGQYWVAFLLLAISLLAVLFSADAICFLVFFEVMSLASIALVASEHVRKDVRKATAIYLGATRLASAILAGGFLWMHQVTHTWSFANWEFSQPSTHGAALMILLALCIKAGIWPFHVWLPYAYSAAPSTASAFMSGFMSKVAMLAIVKILVIGHLNAPFVIWTAFALGAVTAFWGILFALVQNNLKRLIAYSSIENMGLILMCIACSLSARLNNHTVIADLALVAAIVHCLNHGLFKSLLFLSVGAVERASSTFDLEHLGGLAQRMPTTWICICIASLAACAIPPLNGFPGKWILYQSLVSYVNANTSLIEKAASLIAICSLSGVGAMGLAAFVKALGVAFLGRPRSSLAGRAKECTTAMLISQIFLAGCCVVSGLFVNELVTITSAALASSGLPTTAVDLHLSIMPIAATLFCICLVCYFAFLHPSKPRLYTTWDCGYGAQNVKSQVTANSFAQPSARIFRPILRYQNLSKISGTDRRHFPERVHVETRIISILETKVYGPMLAIIDYSSRSIAKLQAGSIHIYLLYVCSTLIVLLLLGVAF